MDSIQNQEASKATKISADTMAEQEEEAAWRDSYIELLRVNVEARGQLIRVQRLNQTLQNDHSVARAEQTRTGGEEEEEKEKYSPSSSASAESSWKDQYRVLQKRHDETRRQLIRAQRLNQTLQNHSNGFRIIEGNKDNANNFIAAMHGYNNPTTNPSWIDIDGNNNNKETTCNNNIKTTIKKSNPKTNKYSTKPNDKPSRPLSAYNLFFKFERERIIARGGKDFEDDDDDDDDDDNMMIKDIVASIESILKQQNQNDHRGRKRPKKRSERISHNTISFGDLARTIAKRWKNIHPNIKKVYDHYAAKELIRHRKDVSIWQQKQKKMELEQEHNKNNNDDDDDEKSNNTLTVPNPVSASASHGTLGAVVRTKSIIQQHNRFIAQSDSNNVTENRMENRSDNRWSLLPSSSSACFVSSSSLSSSHHRNYEDKNTTIDCNDEIMMLQRQQNILRQTMGFVDNNSSKSWYDKVLPLPSSLSSLTENNDTNQGRRVVEEKQYRNNSSNNNNNYHYCNMLQLQHTSIKQDEKKYDSTPLPPWSAMLNSHTIEHHHDLKINDIQQQHQQPQQQQNYDTRLVSSSCFSLSSDDAKLVADLNDIDKLIR